MPFASVSSCTVPLIVAGPQTPKFFCVSDWPEPIEPVLAQDAGAEHVQPAWPTTRTSYEPLPRPVSVYCPSEFVTLLGSPASRPPLRRSC